MSIVIACSRSLRGCFLQGPTRRSASRYATIVEKSTSCSSSSFRHPPRARERKIFLLIPSGQKDRVAAPGKTGDVVSTDSGRFVTFQIARIYHFHLICGVMSRSSSFSSFLPCHCPNLFHRATTTATAGWRMCGRASILPVGFS